MMQNIMVAGNTEPGDEMYGAYSVNNVRRMEGVPAAEAVPPRPIELELDIGVGNGPCLVLVDPATGRCVGGVVDIEPRQIGDMPPGVVEVRVTLKAKVRDPMKVPGSWTLQDPGAEPSPFPEFEFDPGVPVVSVARPAGPDLAGIARDVFVAAQQHSLTGNAVATAAGDYLTGLFRPPGPKSPGDGASADAQERTARLIGQATALQEKTIAACRETVEALRAAANGKVVVA